MGYNREDTIVAPASSCNNGLALGIVRLSGEKALQIADKIFSCTKKNFSLTKAEPYHLYVGTLSHKGKTIDEVVLAVFRAPHSFSGEDVVEITHHGSAYIQQSIVQSLIDCGARMAQKGEFSFRAFLSGKLNLSQAEAVADIIASNNRASLDIALKQLKGPYNDMLSKMRERFLHIASMLELEIDFSEEHEVFVDRKKLVSELNVAKEEIAVLLASFEEGNAFKNGIAVTIAGSPNSGKSTLLNTILKEDRSIVSDVEGTTRDTIEECFSIDGVRYRFIDTAGIRQSSDSVERKGIERSYGAIDKAKIVLFVSDITTDKAQREEERKRIFAGLNLEGKLIIDVLNKADKQKTDKEEKIRLEKEGAVIVSAKYGTGIDELLSKIASLSGAKDFESKVFLTNSRHYEAMSKALQELEIASLATKQGLSADLISENIRTATSYLGEISGEVCNEDVLENIFSNFCIGK